MPACPNKERCGSCRWSHIPYEKQLQQKLSDINGSFALKDLDLTAEEIAPSPVTEHYRNRMDFVIDFEGRVGMREKGKWWKVIDDHTCFLGDEKIERAFPVVRKWAQSCGLSFFDRKAHTGLLRYAVFRATVAGDLMVIIVTSEPTADDVLEPALTSLNESLAQLEGIRHLTLIHSINTTVSDVSFGTELRTVSGQGFIEESINGLTFRITPNAFFQTNSQGAQVLMDTVREFAGDVSEKTVLDLYCGSGFFGIGLAEHAKTVIGVELVEEAIADAKLNAQANALENISFHAAKTEAFDWGQYQADLVILDPPRSGLHDDALNDVMTHAPEEIIYVSCNYKNFARELVRLSERYEVTDIRAIDMFPHTPHVELVTRLQKRVVADDEAMG